jgi:hypothetical protein
VAYGAFTERAIRPDEAAVHDVLGDARGRWDELVGFVSDTHRARGELRFYGRNHGWALTFRKYGKSLLGLFPDAGALTALVVLTDEQVGRALTAGLSKPVRDLVARTTPIHEGRWLYVPVRSARDVADVKVLVGARAVRPPAPPRRCRPAGPTRGSGSRDVAIDRLLRSLRRAAAAA